MFSGATGAGAGSLSPVSRISVVGVPSSAASYAAGQDLAPAALRSAGLLEQLIASGSQNAGQATVSVQQLADRLCPLRPSSATRSPSSTAATAPWSTASCGCASPGQ